MDARRLRTMSTKPTPAKPARKAAPRAISKVAAKAAPKAVESAPAIHHLRNKALGALAVALVLWALIFSAINFEWVTLEGVLGVK